MDEVDRWANIPSDLMGEIWKQLYSFDDYMRLRSVCKAWRSMVPKIPNHPWIVLSNTTLDTRCLEDEGIYHLMLQGMQDDAFICGSGHGWLVFSNEFDGTVGMLNPFTKARLDLPPFLAPPSSVFSEYTCLSLSDDDDMIYAEEMHRKCVVVHKVVISSPPGNGNVDFMAVALYWDVNGECCRLAFYKHHDRSGWRDIATTESNNPEFEDVIFFQDKIYAVNMDAQLYEFDTKTKPVPVGGISEAVASPPDIVGKDLNKYLIGCADGNLMMLVKGLDYLFYQTYKWDIFKLNRSAREWSRVYSLDDYVLLIGCTCSIQISPHTFSHGKGDQIFYAEELLSYGFRNVQHIGIFNLKDASTKNNLLLGARFLCPPLWLLP